MGGGLLQLVAYGAQDAYITGNPHITFWKVLYKRHTNFAIEAMRVNFTGAPAYGQRVVAVVNRNADLIWKTYVEVTLPDTRIAATGLARTIQWSGDSLRRLGYILLNKIEVEIGGQVIDRHYGEWLYLWENLTSSYDNSVKLDSMLGASVMGTTSAFNACNSRPNVLYIPLQFWFNRNPGLALPLIALQYHEVRFNITLAPATDLVRTAAVDSNNSSSPWTTLSQAAQNLPEPRDMALYIDYVYLDVDERRRFAQDSHEYLIDQLQTGIPQTITSPQGRLDLTLNHPVKELIWVFQDVRRTDCSLPGGITDPNTNATPDYVQKFVYDDIAERCRIQLNGQDRFDERFGDYFWKVQPYQHHSGGAFWPTRTAFTNTSTQAAIDPIGFGFVNPVNVYSFAIQPEEHQPSGTCNFSRIDTATLVYDTYGATTTGSAQTAPSKTTPFSFRVYAVNYNIFRIMSGMGGLAYSN
jgi:hypothetical protein